MYKQSPPKVWSGLSPSDHEEFMNVLRQIKNSNEQVFHFLKAEQMRALEAARMYAVAEGFRPDSTTTVDAVKKTQNNILINGFLAVVPAAAGAVTIQIGDYAVPYTNPPSGIINPTFLAYNVSHSSILRMTVAAASTGLYFACFGRDLGNSGMVGAL